MERRSEDSSSGYASLALNARFRLSLGRSYPDAGSAHGSAHGNALGNADPENCYATADAGARSLRREAFGWWSFEGDRRAAERPERCQCVRRVSSAGVRLLARSGVGCGSRPVRPGGWSQRDVHCRRDPWDTGSGPEPGGRRRRPEAASC